jgi:hypothetical protein
LTLGLDAGVVIGASVASFDRTLIRAAEAEGIAHAPSGA